MSAVTGRDSTVWSHACGCMCMLVGKGMRLCEAHRLLCQARDLRLLDAAPASSPPAVLARDKAIIVNLEFIKCIITTGKSSLTCAGCAKHESGHT
jgi:hypothetical protein